MVDRFATARASLILDHKDRHWVRRLYRPERVFAKRSAHRLSRRSASALIRRELTEFAS